MNRILRLVPVVLLGLAVTAAPALGQAAKKDVPAAGDSKNVKAMAGILMNLNHFPSDAEKTQLQAIVSDASASAEEKTVATALLGLQHKVADADKSKLQAIIDGKDSKISESLKTIAAALAGLNHTPSAAEKEKLKKIAG